MLICEKRIFVWNITLLILTLSKIIENFKFLNMDYMGKEFSKRYSSCSYYSFPGKLFSSA